MDNLLLKNINKVHTTEMGEARITQNLCISSHDIVNWCKKQIIRPDARIVRRGKNWYIVIEDKVITVNTSSYTVITAHKIKKEGRV